MPLEHMEEVKTAEQLVGRASGRISLVAEAIRMNGSRQRRPIW